MPAIRAHGKCILAGEHGVVRGGRALVLPLASRSLTLAWEPASQLEVEPGPLAEPFRASLEVALPLLPRALEPRARVRLTSDIPVRAGLGSSAALAVALVRWLERLGAEVRDPFALALKVEDVFHGTSSGLDVAAVLHSCPLRFRRGEKPEPLSLAWRPHFYLADSGQRSSTKECVEKVRAAARPDLDARMQEAVDEIALALADPRGLAALARGIERANECFLAWGLAPAGGVAAELRARGALAVKPTGSGGGGYLLSLWERPPPLELGLIPVWEDSSPAL